MIVEPILTKPVTTSHNLLAFLDDYLPDLEEHSIVVLTSKVISIMEGNILPVPQTNKEDLIIREAEQYIPRDQSKYGVTLTIKDSVLIANSGIDESNGNGNFILWPRDPFKTASLVYEYLQEDCELEECGVIITDSRVTPMRWGTIGVALAWSGFSPLNSYIEMPDIFGRHLKHTKASIIDGLAAAAVVAMGEGNEQTPLAVISDIPFVHFTGHAPTDDEIEDLQIEPEDDLFAPLLMSAPWQKGKKN